jgi:hypothetical protein
MGWFSRKRKPDAAAPMVEDLIRQLAATPPAPTTPAARPSLEEMRARVAKGGLSYIMSPPADLPSRQPEASSLHMQGAMGALTGDDHGSLASFTRALELVRAIGHRPAEARLLYNMGVAHFRLDDLDRAIDALAEGRAVAEGASSELKREARKLQRQEEEHLLEHPNVDIIGTPEIDQELLAMFLRALAVVHRARGDADLAASFEHDAEQLYRKGR